MTKNKAKKVCPAAAWASGNAQHKCGLTDGHKGQHVCPCGTQTPNPKQLPKCPCLG